MRAAAGLIQLVLGAAADHLAPVLDVVLQHFFERQHARLVVFHQRQHVDAEGHLHLGELEQVVQHLFGLCILLQDHHQPDARAIRLVAHVADAFDLAILDQLGDALDADAPC